MSKFVRGQNGMIYQSGLGVGKRGQIPIQMPLGNVYQAIVMKTYAVDDVDNTRGYQVVCDVILLQTMAPLFAVPVSLSIGINNASIPWVPKPTTGTLSGEPLRLRALDRIGNFEGAPTSFLDMNGDIVNVQFVEGNHQRPLITGRRVHQATKRLVKKGNGWSNARQDTNRGNPQLLEAYYRHSGLELRVNADGDLLVDTVGTTKDTVTETPAATGGEQRFRLKRGKEFIVAAGSLAGVGNAGGKDLFAVKQNVDSSVSLRAADDKLTISIDPTGGLVVEVKDGVKFTKPVVGPGKLDLLSASQPFVRGLSLQSALTNLVLAINTYATALGPPGPPSPVTTAQTAPAAATLAAALVVFSTEVAASLSLLIKGE